MTLYSIMPESFYFNFHREAKLFTISTHCHCIQWWWSQSSSQFQHNVNVSSDGGLSRRKNSGSLVMHRPHTCSVLDSWICLILLWGHSDHMWQLHSNNIFVSKVDSFIILFTGKIPSSRPGVQKFYKNLEATSNLYTPEGWHKGSSTTRIHKY